MPMNIVLVGMSGAGKSTIGALLATALGMDFVDTDQVIEQTEGKLLQEIIDQEGMASFMAIEEQRVSELRIADCILSTGGSVIYSAKAMNVLKQGGRVVYLHVPYEEIERRLTNLPTRGIVRKSGASLRDVYEERLPLYQEHGDITIDCTNRDVASCVAEMLEKVRPLLASSSVDGMPRNQNEYSNLE